MINNVLLIFSILIVSCSILKLCNIFGKEGFVSQAQIPMRTCYPSGSADVSNCFTQPNNHKVEGVYITSAKVGNKACPWAKGDPAYWDIIKQRKKDTGMKVWGLLNMVGTDPMPNWEDIAKCVKGPDDKTDSRYKLFDGLMIDAEHLSDEQCQKMSDLSSLGIPTLSTIGGGTCQNYINPEGHGYVAMCYDGAEKKTPCLDCSTNKMKGVDVQKFMYSMDQWPNNVCKNKPIDVYGFK
jgi:hypothetical protein